MIGLALDKCKEYGIDKVLISCNEDNIGSKKSIIKNGGVYERTVLDNGKNLELYWIDLNNEIRIVYDGGDCASFAMHHYMFVGECEYEIKDDKWFIVHTGVRPEYGGRGIAKQLVLKIIEEARKKHVKIVPICSYAQKLMLNNKEYEDVLAESYSLDN